MWRTAVALLTLTGLAMAAGAQVQERVDVSRVLVDVRVTTDGGQPIKGLTGDDFRVEIDGRRARVESASWVGYRKDVPEADAAASPAAPTPLAPRAAGRLAVFMFQNSIDRSRIGGLLQMMHESARFVDRLGSADQAAVVVFDSRLRVWQDFTSDRVRLSEVLGKEVMFERPNENASAKVSLLNTIDRDAADRAASMESALLVVGRALEKIEGAKSLVIFGYGFGRFISSVGSPMGLAELDATYEQARDTLIRARVTVFAMDVTNAEQHTLETGLIASAEDTGGFYERVNRRQAHAMDRLEGALEGYYMLSVEKPAGKPGRHAIKVRTGARGANVDARRYYLD
jgi:VWFA-related protein